VEAFQSKQRSHVPESGDVKLVPWWVPYPRVDDWSRATPSATGQHMIG
jgi:hypothetical protein